MGVDWKALTQPLNRVWGRIDWFRFRMPNAQMIGGWEALFEEELQPQGFGFLGMGGGERNWIFLRIIRGGDNEKPTGKMGPRGLAQQVRAREGGGPFRTGKTYGEERSFWVRGEGGNQERTSMPRNFEARMWGGENSRQGKRRTWLINGSRQFRRCAGGIHDRCQGTPASTRPGTNQQGKLTKHKKGWRGAPCGV